MNAIVIESVSKNFQQRPSFIPWKGHKRADDIPALADISLCVPSGTVQVLLGPNGSGKTTLLKLIATMLLPDSGTLLVEGFSTARAERQVRTRVGFAVANERSFFPRLTARENLDCFAALDEVPRRERNCRVSEILNTVGFSKQAEKLTMNFSSGMCQRLGIARALLKHPSILLLDEPSRSLDPGSAMQLWNLIRELADQSTTVLVASHNFQETVAVADHVAIMGGGRVRREYRAAQISSAERLRKLYFDSVGSEDEDRSIFDIDVAGALAG
jgi:ABC-2 type transport system ATP-binding protein